MHLRLAILICALLLSGASSQYKVQRAGLVPHQQPNQRSGHAIGDNSAELSLGTSTLSILADPERADDANAGLYIPRVHVAGGARFRMNRNFDLGVLFDYGLDEGSIPIEERQPKIDNGDVYGGGATMQYVVATGNPDLTIGFGLDLLLYSVPYVEYIDCFENCIPGDPLEGMTRDRENVWVGAFGITPAWKLNDNIAVFGGVTMRNHPTVKRYETQDALDAALGDDDVVEGGPANFITNAGIEYTFNGGVRAMLHVYQPINANPVQYGPTFGAAITIPLGRDPKRDPAAAPPPAYPPVAQN